MPNAVALARARRVVAVTAGLTGAGAVGGALCGAAAVAMVVAADSGLRWMLRHPDLLAIGAAFGAAVGAVAAPLFAWVLLRRVALWLAISGTALGTMAGAATGQLLQPVSGAIYGGFVGFAVAAICLHIAARRKARATAAAERLHP